MRISALTEYEGPRFERLKGTHSRSSDEANFSCRNKVAYRTENRARKARRYAEGTIGLKVPYFCRHCTYYHLGSK